MSLRVRDPEEWSHSLILRRFVLELWFVTVISAGCECITWIPTSAMVIDEGLSKGRGKCVFWYHEFPGVSKGRRSIPGTKETR
jgi:hypothetical protein